MAAPDYIHELLDLTWDGPGVMSEYTIVRRSIPGEVWVATRRFSDVLFEIDLRPKQPKWTVSVGQPQPEPVPAQQLTREQYAEWLRERKRRYEQKYGRAKGDQ